MIRAWIFDFDDTLVSSGPVWQRAEREVFRTIGGMYDESYARSYRGLNAMDVGERIHRRVSPKSYSSADCGEMLRALLVEYASTDAVEMDGASEILSTVSRSFSVAIASGSPLPLLESVIDRLGWSDFVGTIVSSEEVPQGKPAPDVFIEASRRLSVTPGECVVVEDSLHGVRAAKAAGMSCILVGDDADACREADQCVGSLTEINPDSTKNG